MELWNSMAVHFHVVLVIGVNNNGFLRLIVPNNNEKYNTTRWGMIRPSGQFWAFCTQLPQNWHQLSQWPQNEKASCLTLGKCLPSSKLIALKLLSYAPVTLKLTPVTPKWVGILLDPRQVSVPSSKLVALKLFELCSRNWIWPLWPLWPWISRSQLQHK